MSVRRGEVSKRQCLISGRASKGEGNRSFSVTNELLDCKHPRPRDAKKTAVKLIRLRRNVGLN